MDSLKKKLQIIFGREDFDSTLQKKAFETVYYGKKDALVCTLNNAETSLCMLLLGIAEKRGLTIVITPTRAYAEEQVQYLKSKNISAFYWHGCSTNKAVYRIKREMKAKNSKLKVLYVTYCQVKNADFLFILKESKYNLSNFMIHKAEYLNPLMPNFRNEYTKLGNLKKVCSEVPITAFTSASIEVAKYIVHALQQNNPIVLDNEIYNHNESNDAILIESDSGESVVLFSDEDIPHKEITNTYEDLTPSIKPLKLNNNLSNIQILRKTKNIISSDSEESDSTIIISDDES